MDVEKIVDQALALDAEIKLRQEKLKSLKLQLIERGAGEYGTKNGKAIVVVPSASLKVPDDTLIDAQAKLEKNHFEKLFECVVTYKPVKAFREIAKALLKPAAARKLIAACEVTGEPYVKLKPA